MPKDNLCPLCKKEQMYATLTVESYPTNKKNLGNHCRVAVKFTCWNDQCHYEERTKGYSSNPETVQKMMDVILGYRGSAMFKKGKFEDGQVGINRRRHTKAYKFEAVEKEEIK